MIRRTIVLLVVVLLTSLALAVGDDDPAAVAYRSAYELILKKQWAEAKTRFEAILQQYPRSPLAEDSRYWICHAREKLGGSPEDIYACFADFIEKYPHNKYTDQARSNLVTLAVISQMSQFSGETVLAVPMRTSEEEDAKLASLFALQVTDSVAALQEASRLYDASANEAFRGKLTYVLGSFRTAGAMGKLRQILRDDPSPTIRRDVVTVLASARVTQAYDVLRELVRSSAPSDLRARAIQALRMAGVPGLDTLCFALALWDVDPTVSGSAVDGLVFLGTQQVDDARMMRLFRDAKSQGVRRTAFLSLVGLNRRVLKGEALRKVAASHPDRIIRLIAVQLRGMTGDTLEVALAMIDCMNLSTRMSSCEQIVEMLSPSGVRAGMRSRFVSIACVAWSTEWVAKTAVYGLDKLLAQDGGRVFATIAGLSRYPSVRKDALEKIAALHAPVPVGALSGFLLKETDPGIRLSAIRALTVQKNDSVVAVLLEAAEAATDPAIRTAAVTGLKSLGTPKAHDALKALEAE